MSARKGQYTIMTDVVVVIPTYNEADNIVPLVEAIYNVTPDYDILFVDDNSQDGTQDRISECQSKYLGKIHLLSRQAKLGLGTAYIAGFTWVLRRHYQVAISMDADLSHDPRCLRKMSLVPYPAHARGGP
jgi:dolichol-phosphate mannosyltransferase